jgi:hypothetical protein
MVGISLAYKIVRNFSWLRTDVREDFLWTAR